MQLQSDRTCDQSKQSSHEGVEQLKRKISLSNSELHEIISNPENFSQRIKDLNRKGLIQINQELYQEALIYFTEAEKNLQYAASCGISLDRILIASTLKNQALSYQRLWELGTCYDYMEALIFNLSTYVKQGEDIEIAQQVKVKGSEESKRINKILNHQLQMALNYLQFSALSSQLSKHQEARRTVQKSLSEFRILIALCCNFQKILTGKSCLLLEKIRENMNFKEEGKPKKMISSCRKAIYNIRNQRYFFNFDSKVIEAITMGDIMQINSVSFEETMKTQNDWFISQFGLTTICIYISCCYFALATQIRLSIQKDVLHEQNKQALMQLAKKYHLHSINMASNIVLIESSILNHIIKSLKNNFGIDIHKQNASDCQEQQISEIDFQIGRIAVNQKKKVENNLKKSEDGGTKAETLESNGGQLQDKYRTKSIPRKLSTVKIVLSPKNREKNRKSGKQPFDERNMKSGKNIGFKSEYKSSLKNEREDKDGRQKMNIHMNMEYFGRGKDGKDVKQERNRTKYVCGSEVVSKDKRKTQVSSSKGKLKMKGVKSPNKQ